MSHSDPTDLEKQTILVRSLLRTLGLRHGASQCIETHISWVIVAGEFAYKLKKAVRFDFLDYSTIESRCFFCHEEVRLNQRLAPTLYLGVVSIRSSPESAMIDVEEAGEIIEYAVKMRAFSQDALWRHRITHQGITETEVDALARKLGAFHVTAAAAPLESAWGGLDVIREAMEQNLSTIQGLIDTESDRQKFDVLWAWKSTQLSVLGAVFESRKSRGFIRECHGDLHCGNVLSLEGRVDAFDCIEFNDSLRWIDVLSDLAFILMDMQCHGAAALAARLLNTYLDVTGDYEDLAVLRYYLTYRALVRCKVYLLPTVQLAPKTEALAVCKSQASVYLSYAAQCTAPGSPVLMILHGFSGSGKSTLARTLVGILGAVQIASDVERKRLHGLDPLQDTASIASVLYSTESTQKTYDRLYALASCIVSAGFSVIVDAAFLKMEERRRFALLADSLRVPFYLVDVRATEDTIRRRLAERNKLKNDPSDANHTVLTRQLAFLEGLSDEERKHVMVVDTDSVNCIDGGAMRRLLAHAGLRGIV